MNTAMHPAAVIGLLPWHSSSEKLLGGSWLRADFTAIRDAFIKEYIHRCDSLLATMEASSAAFLKIIKQRFISFDEFGKLRSGNTQGLSMYALHYWKLLKSHRSLPIITANDDDDYTELLKKYLPKTNAFFFSPQPVPVPIAALDRHLLITGRTGSGKTEFLKALFYQLQFHSHTKKNAALCLLDPHGDLSEQLLSLKLNLQDPKRIWYIDPQLHPKFIPCLNPFWHPVKDAMLVDLLAQQWAKTFSELVPETGVSLQMEALLKPCLAVLFRKGGSGLSDLQNFMDNQSNEQWIAWGKADANPVYRNFFNTAFSNKKYDATKLAVYTRLQLLLNNQSFYRMMNGAATIDLKRGMDEGAVIIFNLSKGKLGEDTSRALGRFVSATLLSIALQRAFEPVRSRKACYLFADEFHNIAADSGSIETLYAEARKYRLHLLAGLQHIGQLSPSMKDMVLNNTAVKLVGLNGLPSLKGQAGDIGVSFAALQQLPAYHFYLKIDHHPALKIKSPDFLLKNAKKYNAAAKELAALKEYLLQQSGLYRSIQEEESFFSHNQNKSLSPNQREDNTQEFKPRFGL